jgi:hypothetical protein
LILAGDLQRLAKLFVKKSSGLIGKKRCTHSAGQRRLFHKEYRLYQDVRGLADTYLIATRRLANQRIENKLECAVSLHPVLGTKSN